MIIDLQGNSAAPAHLEADVFIAGAGPAGISLALELARLRPDWHIVLAEAGGSEEPTRSERDIYKLALGDKSYSVLDICRRRKLGGTSAHWGGWSKPPDTADFMENPNWDLPAWPFGAEELAPYLPAACQWCEIGSADFDIAAVRQDSADHLLSLDEDSRLAEHLFRFSPPTRFGLRYREQLEQQGNLSCLLHANLMNLGQEGDRTTFAELAPLGEAVTRVAAREFVLAMGGIETTRHLLNLRGDEPADGEGIHSPHLGRYFADHFGFSPGQLLAPADLRYSRFRHETGAAMPVLTFAEAELLGVGQNNSAIYLWAESDEDSLLRHYGGLPTLGFNKGEYWHYHVKVIVEPRPNFASALSLTEDRDALGLRRAKLDWHIHEQDFASAYQLVSALGRELGAAGSGRLQISQPNTPEMRAQVTGGCHHMGTTRMAASSRDGVTDPELRVYGSANLYIASSAVIPRYGYSNPTLTTVALSVRLAHHLAGSSREVADDQAA